MWYQAWVLFILKWTLVKRGWGKQHLSGYLLLAILLIVGMVLAAIVAGFLYWLGLEVAERKSPLGLLVLLDGVMALYCIFYAWGVLMELQRSDLIDFRKMLSLPVSLPGIYLINFFVSLLGPLSLFSIPVLGALFWGIHSWLGPSVFTAGFPLAAAFVIMLGAWAYYLRGRLAILMENPRRRRIVFMLLPIGFILLAQSPALIMQLVSKGASGQNPDVLFRAAEPYVILLNQALPLFWPAYGLTTFVTTGPAWIMPLCLAGMGLVTFLGFGLGYGSTLRHYMGLYENVRASTPVQRKTLAAPVTSRTLPFLAGDTSALAFGFYKSFSRHPHVRMLLLMPVCFGMFVLFMHRSGAYGDSLGDGNTWIPMAGLIWPFINFALFMFNVFGIDASSFLALQLLPVPRYKYLLAKNIALAPIILGLAVFFIAASAFVTDVSARTVLLALLLSVQLFLLFSATGNFLSIKYPRRLHRDALRTPGRRLYMIISGFAATLLSTLLVLPASVCMLLDRFPPPVLVEKYGPFMTLVPALLITAVTLLAYWRSLVHAGDLLMAEEQAVHARLAGDRD